MAKQQQPKLRSQSRFVQKTAEELFSSPAEREEFLRLLDQTIGATPALVWMEDRPEPLPFRVAARQPWQPIFVDVVDAQSGVGRHHLHEAGAFYMLDLSSVLSASAMLQCEGVRTVLDVCAAPGGKSLFAWRAVRPDLLVSNEVIGKRHGALVSNLRRCGAHGALVTRFDPSQLAERAASRFDLVVVDAPCSGQSLVVRGKEQPGCFHPRIVAMNAKRQRRILAESAKVVRPGGYLLYVTCTYALQENEELVEWFLDRQQQFKAVDVAALAPFRSPHIGVPCYRHTPLHGVGAGGFAALMMRSDGEPWEAAQADLFPEARRIE